MFAAQAQPRAVPPLETFRLEAFVVEGRDDSLLGIAASASEGLVGAEELASRPILRVGELLESIPGVIVTQHSGAGKANQFFLRGFNLDHGTDLATFVDGAPINLPSHGHGQGYTDLNFVLPEIVRSVRYRRGPYFADPGDFASAGAAKSDNAAKSGDEKDSIASIKFGAAWGSRSSGELCFNANTGIHS